MRGPEQAPRNASSVLEHIHGLADIVDRGAFLIMQNNIAVSYDNLGRHHESLRLKRVVYSGRLKLLGEEHMLTLSAANNCVSSLGRLQRFEEAKALLRKIIPVARRVLGDNDTITSHMRKAYAQSLYHDDSATLDDLREAVTTLEDTERTARRVFGCEHPSTVQIGISLRNARAALRAREDGKKVKFVKH